MVAEWLHGYWWKDPEKPLFRVTTACPKLIWEIGQQRHREYSAKVAVNREQPEELVDKDNHSWDALKQLLRKFPPKFHVKRPGQSPNTFAWWKKLTKDGIQRQTASFRV